MVYVVAKEDKDRIVNSIDMLEDHDWLKNTFMLSDKMLSEGTDYNDWIRSNRFYTTADIKIAATSPGMTMAVNPKPQFTRYADPRSPGKLKTRRPSIRKPINAEEQQGSKLGIHTYSSELGLGLGHYYSEAFDDNGQNVFFRFGVPQYTNLVVWMSKAFDINKTVMANRGVITSTILQAINIVGKVLAIATAPLLAVGAGLINAAIVNTRFYNVKETMYLYWSSVESVLNSMVARKTLVPMFLKDYTVGLDNRMQTKQSVDYGFREKIWDELENDMGENSEDPQLLDDESVSFVRELNKLMPNVVSERTGRISVYALALRYQVAYNRILYEEYMMNESGELRTSDNPEGYRSVNPEGSPEYSNVKHDSYFTNDQSVARSFTRYMFMTAANVLGEKTDDTSGYKAPPSDGDNLAISTEDGSMEFKDTIEMNPAFVDANGNPIGASLMDEEGTSVDQAILDNVRKKKDTFWKKLKEYGLAELTDGGMFAVFQVDSTGSVGESFSNSTSSNPIESVFNAVSSKSRNFSRQIKSLTDGIPLVSNVIDFAGDAAASAISSATFGLANPILAIAYGLEVKMPKVWESSSSSLPRASYSMRLISPYGNAYSQLFNIYLPLAMLMAGSLPRSTGKASHTSPFVCQVFDKGRLVNQLGMIDQFSVTRGTSTLAFTRGGDVNAVDVDLSVVNLDDALSVEIADAGLFGSAFELLNLDYSPDNFTDYINAITGVDVYNQIMRVPAARLKAAERWMTFSRAFVDPDPAAYASFTGNRVIPKGVSSILFRNSGRAMTERMIQR